MPDPELSDSIIEHKKHVPYLFVPKIRVNGSEELTRRNIFMPVIYLGELADVAYPDWQGIKTEITAGAREEAG